MRRTSSRGSFEVRRLSSASLAFARRAYFLASNAYPASAGGYGNKVNGGQSPINCLIHPVDGDTTEFLPPATLCMQRLIIGPPMG